VLKVLVTSLFSGILLYYTPTLMAMIKGPLTTSDLITGLLTVCACSAALPVIIRYDVYNGFGSNFVNMP